MENIFRGQISGYTSIFRKSKTLILGCGGLGIDLRFMFTKSGIGRIKIVDYNTIEYFNSSRQIYKPTDIGKHKVNTFKKIYDEFLPFTNISAENIKIIKNNIDESTDGYDIVFGVLDDEYVRSLALEHFIGIDKKLVSVSGTDDVKELDMKTKKMSNIVVYGDFETRTDISLYYPNMVMAASTQAIIVLSWLLEENSGR